MAFRGRLKTNLTRGIVPFDAHIRAAPRGANLSGVVCLTCGNPVGSVEVVDSHRGSYNNMQVLARCHHRNDDKPEGPFFEDLKTVEFGSENWDDYDVRTELMKQAFFDPTEGLGLDPNKARGIPGLGDGK